jgi:hypothetical protein
MLRFEFFSFVPLCSFLYHKIISLCVVEIFYFTILSKKVCFIAQGKNTENIIPYDATENGEPERELLIKMLLKNQEVMEKMIEMISLIRNRTGM